MAHASPFPHTIKIDRRGSHVPIFVQGDKPDEWHQATHEQRQAIKEYSRQGAHCAAYDPHASGPYINEHYRVTEKTIQSRKIPGAPERVYTYESVPFGPAYSHDGFLKPKPPTE